MKQSNDKVYVKETVRFLSPNIYSTSSVSKRQTGASQSTKRGGNLWQIQNGAYAHIGETFLCV